jgi:hypothetical protein
MGSAAAAAGVEFHEGGRRRDAAYPDGAGGRIQQ